MGLYDNTLCGLIPRWQLTVYNGRIIRLTADNAVNSYGICSADVIRLFLYYESVSLSRDLRSFSLKNNLILSAKRIPQLYTALSDEGG